MAELVEPVLGTPVRTRLEERDAPSAFHEPGCERRACRSCPDDDHVGLDDAAFGSQYRQQPLV
jgi:hypothetical protein